MDAKSRSGTQRIFSMPGVKKDVKQSFQMVFLNNITVRSCKW
uniref:Uncharacterized protein n=1 Tax=Anguilla anguilla TaxID=7936 RepID=A0A0E9SBT4_ANGAN